MLSRRGALCRTGASTGVSYPRSERAPGFLFFFLFSHQGACFRRAPPLLRLGYYLPGMYITSVAYPLCYTCSLADLWPVVGSLSCAPREPKIGAASSASRADAARGQHRGFHQSTHARFPPARDWPIRHGMADQQAAARLPAHPIAGKGPGLADWLAASTYAVAAGRGLDYY